MKRKVDKQTKKNRIFSPPFSSTQISNFLHPSLSLHSDKHRHVIIQFVSVIDLIKWSCKLQKVKLTR